MRVFLIRHGQTEWNVAQRAQGHSDIPLDDVGVRQAELLARSMDGHRLERVYSSDLGRAVETAAPITRLTGAELIATPSLRERSFGEWEGQPYGVIRAGVTASGLPSHEFAPPGGESLVYVQQRITQWWTDLPKRGAIGIVSHGGTCSLLLALLLDAPPSVSRSFRFSNTGVCELNLRDDGAFQLVRYNCTAHLEEAARESAFGVIG